MKFPEILKSIALIFFLLMLAPASAQVLQWVTKGGGSGNDYNNAIAADNQGNIYTIGTFTGIAVFDTYTLTSGGKNDVFITRANAATGAITWAKKIGALSDDYGNSITTDKNGNVYCTGRFSGTLTIGSTNYAAVGLSEAFVTKLDPATGAITWFAKLGGTGSDCGNGIAVDLLSNVYATGYFQGMATFGSNTLTPVGSNFNAFVVKLNGTTGNVLWALSMGGSGYTFGNAVATYTLGYVYVTGSMEGTGMFGTTPLTSVGNTDIFIASLDSDNGNVIHAQNFGSTGNDAGSAVIVKSDYEIYTTGKFEGKVGFGTDTVQSVGSSDGFTIKQNLAGHVLWAGSIGGSGYDASNAITFDAAGNLYTIGQFAGILLLNNATFYVNGVADIYIARLNDADGTVSFGMQAGGPGADSGTGITHDAAGAIYAAGFFQLNAAFETTTLVAAGGSDAFALKLNSGRVGFEENTLQQQNISLFPNPFYEQLHVSVNSTLPRYTLTLRDVMGRLILQRSETNAESVINLDDLSAGIYYMTISSATAPGVTKKIIKQ